MATPHHELLAISLKRAKEVATNGIVHARDLSRIDQKRLQKNGWLTRIIRGWYLLKQPVLAEGNSTQWYSSFWNFFSLYLNDRFGKNYCLSANNSLDLHLGSTIIPKQLLVMVKMGGSSVLHLPFNTSIVIYQETNAFPSNIENVNNLQVMSLAMALHRISPRFFQKQPDAAEIALKLINVSELSRELLTGSNIASANRIIGAYEFLREKEIVKRLKLDLLAAGYQIDPVNPFTITEPLLKMSRTQT